MAASVSRIPPAQYCTTCKGWAGHTSNFQKIIDLKNVGLSVYRHTIKIPCSERESPDKTVEITKEIFILHNQKGVKISAAEFMPELEKEIISCSRCLKTVERALTLLRKVANINKNEVRGVCDHCLTKQKYCLDCDNVRRKFMTSSEVKPTQSLIPKPFIKSTSDSKESYTSKIPISRDNISEKREFSAPLFPERPVLSQYAKDILLKMGKEKAQDAAEFLRFYSDTETEDIENLLKMLAEKQTPKAMYEPTTVRFRHSTESIVDDDIKTERLLKERDLKEKQALSFAEHYKKQYSDVEDISGRRRFKEMGIREQKQYRDRYSDEDDFDRKRRPYERAPREQQYRDRYTDDEDFYKKQRIDERAPREQQYRDRYTDDEDFYKKQRIHERAPREQQYRDRYTDEEDFYRKRRTDERAPRKEQYRDRYTDEEDFYRKRRTDERAPREQQYRDRYTDEEYLYRKRRTDERAPREQQYRDRYTDEEDLNRKKRIDDKTTRAQQHRDRYSDEVDLDIKRRLNDRVLKDGKVESKQLIDEPPLKATLKKKIEPSTVSRELLLKKKSLAPKIADNIFSFPEDKKKKPSVENISSSELIKDTREKLEEKAEMEKERKRQAKLQAEKIKIEKRKEREEKAKFHAESPVIDDGEKHEDGKKIEQLKRKSDEDVVDKKGTKKQKRGKDKELLKQGEKKKEEKIKEKSKKDSQGTKKQKGKETELKEMKPPEKKKKESKLENLKIVKSLDDAFLKLIQLRKDRAIIRSVPQLRGEEVRTKHPRHKHHKKSQICVTDDIESDQDILECEKIDEAQSDIIIGTKICKRTHSRVEKKKLDESIYTEKTVDIKLPSIVSNEEDEKPSATGQPKGVLRYALSDRSFIDKGWTVLPTKKFVRKMNVYRMKPSKPEFDWFKHNKNKRLMNYDTGEKLADFDENGRGRCYYKNGRVALDYYEPEEKNCHKRFVIYSSGEPDDLGRAQPYTVLAVFDYLGNGIVYDHTGKIRLKYNQTEGVLLDGNVGPESHWKWHTLNDPPVLQEVIIDTQLPYKDTAILELGPDTENNPFRENYEEMLTVEFENFIKEKSRKLTQSFKPFQIRMKALKINKHFSLKVLDQATIYIIYRNGSTNLKFNIGMILDPKEIVDTVVADLGIVYHDLEKYPAETESLTRIQKCIQYSQNLEKMRLEHDKRFRIPEQSASVDKLTAATSRPMRPPLRTVPSCCRNLCHCKK